MPNLDVAKLFRFEKVLLSLALASALLVWPLASTLVMAAAKAFQPLPAVCPPGWLAWQHSCYILLPDKMNGFQALKLCDRPHSSLVVPDSQEEHDFIWREMKVLMQKFGAVREEDLELWIGCEDPDDKKDGLECLGEKGIPTYTNWETTEPTSLNQTCVRMAEKFDGRWGDMYCRCFKFVACEMRVSRRVYCLTSDADGRFTPQCLLNHHFKNLTATGITGCGQACWTEPRCHSFNLWRQVDNMKLCQLNNATRLEADVTDFKQYEDCTFFEL